MPKFSILDVPDDILSMNSDDSPKEVPLRRQKIDFEEIKRQLSEEIREEKYEMSGLEEEESPQIA